MKALLKLYDGDNLIGTATECTLPISKANGKFPSTEYLYKGKIYDQFFAIGIDPGINNGFAAWDMISKRLIDVRSLDLHELFYTLTNISQKYIVFIENPNTWKSFKGVPTKESDAKKQGAGAVKQTYKHTVQFLEANNINYTDVKLQGTLKKLDAATFKKYTKWDKPTNQHGRDAGLIVYNR